MASSPPPNRLSQNDAPEANGSSTGLEVPEIPYAGFTWTEAGMLVGASLLIGAILLVQALTGPSCCAPASQAEILRSTIGNLSYLFLWAVSAVPIFWACVRLRPRTVGWGAVVAGHAALAFVIPLAVEVGQNAIFAGLINLWPPSDPPSSPFTHPLELFLNLEFLTELIPYFALFTIGLIREGYLRAQAREEQAKQLEREAKQLRSQLTAARLESLRMQINPHFFHNTLHTISTMAGRDPDGIRTATARLSDLMRYVLSTSDQQEVPLEEELDVLDSYLDIQKLRLDDRLEVTKDIEPAARTALVPTLLLQPIVENAVKHGFEGADETGHLEIRAAREGDVLVLEVADDGDGLSDERTLPEDGHTPDPSGPDGGVGLTNIAERLDGLYGEAATLHFEETKRGGLRVIIRLPFRTRDAERNLRAAGIVAD